MKGKFRYLTNKFYNLSMSTKLFVSFFILTIIPLTVFITILYSNVEVSEKAKMEYSANQAFEQAASVLAFKARYINDIMNLLYMDGTLQRIANNASEEYISDYGQQLLDSSNLFKLVYGIENREGINKFKLYVPEVSIFSKDNVTYFNIEEAKKKEWYTLLFESADATLWSPPQYFAYEGITGIIPVLRVVKDLNDFHKSGSVVRLDLSRDEIVEILAKSKVTESSLAMLCNDRFELICATDSKQSDGFLDFLSTDFRGGDGLDWSYSRIGDEEYLVRLYSIADTGWQLIMLIPYSDIFAAYHRFQIDMVIMLIIGIMVVYATAFMISRMNTSRLKDLARHMRHAETGDFDLPPMPGYNDEIGELAKNFSSMMAKIAILLDEKFQLGQKVKSTELKLLQSQINPHFLYNTLDLVNWFSYMGRNEELRDVVESLSKFYKLSLNRGDDEITIGDELDHVKAYVDIQNKRFANKIRLILDVDDGIRQLPILKIILQPIVENSILHGIMENEHSEGTIWISGSREGDDIVMVVEDNGVGMDEDTLIRLQDGSESGAGSSYGLKNITERLEAFYGPGYGLQYFSDKNRGTRVTVRISTHPGREQ